MSPLAEEEEKEEEEEEEESHWLADEWSPEEKEEEKEEEQLHQGRERKRDIFWDIWEDLQ